MQGILSTFIKLPFVIKIFVLSIFEWPFYTGFTVHLHEHLKRLLCICNKYKTSHVLAHLTFFLVDDGCSLCFRRAIY